MENNNLDIENNKVDIQEEIKNENISDENTNIGKSKKPIIILGGLAVIAIIIAAIILNGMSDSDIVNNEDVPSEPEEIQVGLTDYSATNEELSELKDLNTGIKEYVNKHYDEMGIVTAYGFLYSTKTKNNIIVKDIMTDGLVKPNSENIINNTDILYLKAEDIGLSGNELVPCTAFNTKDGYYLSAENLEGKYYNEKEYNALVMKYSFVHGDTINPQKGDDNYKKITDAAKIDESYDIKHIACDDKYAVVVANKINNTSEFVESVLIKNGGNWNVAIGNLATDKNAKQTANKVYNDMELGLFPIYNIGDYKTILPASSGACKSIINQLVEQGMINKGEEAQTYACSAGNFAYIQTPSGKRLVGFTDDSKKLDFTEANSLEEAIAIMVQLQKNDPPVFIIKFN